MIGQLPLYAKVHRLPAFDPSTVALAGWWQSSYSPTSWVSKGSAGTSSGHTFSTPVGNVAPDSATAIGGHTPANFGGGTGTSKTMLTCTDTLTSFVTVSAWQMFVVVLVRTVTSNDSNPQNNQTIIADGGGYFGLFARTAGAGNARLQLYQYSGGQHSITADVPLNQYVLAECSFDGASIRIDCGAGPFTASSGNIDNVANAMYVGKRPSGSLPGLDGSIADVMIAKSSVMTRAQALSYANDRYGLSMV